MALFSAHYRKILTSVALGFWLFGFFAGVVHACGLDGELGHSQRALAASIDSQCQGDDDTHPGCEQFCADNLPMLAKLQGVQDQPGGPALLMRAFMGQPLWPRMVSVRSPPHRSHPPPGIALNTRFVRLAL